MNTRKKFQESSPLHAKHDKSILATRATKPDPLPTYNQTSNSSSIKAPSSSLLSNVCCQDVDEINNQTPSDSSASCIRPASNSLPLPPPPKGGIQLQVGILTVSDRAFHNQYATGDLSGPAVETSIHQIAE